MPTETFLKLPNEKKDRIIIAAKKEFERVSFEEASIKRIMENAEIARGSFYQYFESKEDLLSYLLDSHKEKMEQIMTKTMQETKGDIFEIFIAMYDHAIKEYLNNEEDIAFHKKVFENVKTSQDSIFSIKKEHEQEQKCKMMELCKTLKKDNLKYENEEDIHIIVNMLNMITKKSIVISLKCESKEEARKKYIKQIEYLKYGILKNEEEIC